MQKCGYCGSTVVIGGLRSGDQRFCNAKCLQGAQLLSLASRIAPDVLERQVEEVFHGNWQQRVSRMPAGPQRQFPNFPRRMPDKV